MAAKFSSKAKSTYNKALDQTTSTCTSLFSSFAPLDEKNDSYYAAKETPPSGHLMLRKSSLLSQEDTYDLERIKLEEMNSQALYATSGNRYSKVYKSFRSAIRRNSSASNSSSSSSSINDHSKLISNSSETYITNHDAHSSKQMSKDLDVFQKGYSYDYEESDANLCDYDHSVYPFVKTQTSSNTLTKSSKKVS